jgi:uncharacterized protein
MPRANLRQADLEQSHLASFTPENSQHSIGLSIALHLLPGGALLLFPLLVLPLVRHWAFPPIVAGSLAILLVLLPWEIGYLLYLGRQRNGYLTLAGVVRYREPLPLWQYGLLVPLLILWFFGATSMWHQVEPRVSAWFVWLPGWVLNPLPFSETGSYGASVLLTTTILRFVCSGIIAPIGEELYFRGYLLPRLDHLDYGAPLLNTVLFAFYHLWTPLDNPGRVLALFPLVYVAWRKRNIYVGIAVHLLLNLLAVALPLLR